MPRRDILEVSINSGDRHHDRHLCTWRKRF